MKNGKNDGFMNALKEYLMYETGLVGPLNKQILNGGNDEYCRRGNRASKIFRYYSKICCPATSSNDYLYGSLVSTNISPGCIVRVAMRPKYEHPMLSLRNSTFTLATA